MLYSQMGDVVAKQVAYWNDFEIAIFISIVGEACNDTNSHANLDISLNDVRIDRFKDDVWA